MRAFPKSEQLRVPAPKTAPHPDHPPEAVQFGVEFFWETLRLLKGQFGIRAVLERGAAADIWRNTLSQIPSVFNRLVYLTSLRDENTGVYEHHGLALIFGPDESDRALKDSHAACFHDWLCFTLEQQKADLGLYLASLTSNRAAIIETWLRLRPYANLVPSSAREVEKQLYLADLESLLELLKNEYGVASPDPDA